MHLDGELRSDLLSFEAARSFKVYSTTESLVDIAEQRNYDLTIVPLAIDNVSGDESWYSSTCASSVSGIARPEGPNLAYVDLKDINPAAPNQHDIATTTDNLINSCKRSNFSGLAMRPSDLLPAGQANQLIQRLRYRGISVLLICDHDASDIDSLSWEYISGIILENACILPNGQRRDYFQSKRLRSLMIRCATERNKKPGFFVGFSELWEARPHPSVIRRAVKLADHFGAVVEHGPVELKDNREKTAKHASQTLSGFEYLRRGDVTEVRKRFLIYRTLLIMRQLQKCWRSDLRGVDLGATAGSASVTAKVPQEGQEAPDAAIRALSLCKVDALVPLASQLLCHKPLHRSLKDLGDELPVTAQSPNYLAKGPKRRNFWKFAADGTQLSTAGCYSILAEPSTEDYAAVLVTQCHLHELHMLHAVNGAEVHRITAQVCRLLEQTEYQELINDFIDGLESHRILLFKGLDTGFKVPDGNAYFWGVSKTRDAGDDTEVPPSVHIYISQSSPHDACVAFHTWLAHHGVAREVCVDIEARLEGLSGLASKHTVPTTTKVAIEGATIAETLQLLQQMRAAQLDLCWREPIETLCEERLTSRTTRQSWSRLHARGILDGSMSPRDMLTSRLQHYATEGATHLPLLENLESLYEIMSTTIQDSLFYGGRDNLNEFTNALTAAFEPGTASTPSKKVDINADLFALMFFSILRKAAFEEVYVEATDRCPIFLCADQAAVFSELWVLGSQCEIFLGLLPRDLGDIIYDRYQRFLLLRPPVAADRDGTEIMTMYSTMEASPSSEKRKPGETGGATPPRLSTQEMFQLWKSRLHKVGAISIFSLPAIVDVLMLTFLGRGLFMTAYMDPQHLEAAGYAVLISLLLTAGVTGWVGSTGSYYLAHYAYDNMTHFHVQRLSGGFMLCTLVAMCGFIGFSVARSVSVGFVFVAFVFVITTYLNLLGIMATMHQEGSPMTSGRTVLWRTIPLLLISPIISSFVSQHELAIYLPVTYMTIFVLLYQYRQLCREWTGWLEKIPNITEKDIVKWYESSQMRDNDISEQADNISKAAQEALRDALVSYRRRNKQDVQTGVASNPFVQRAAIGMPYIDWLFKKINPDGNLPEVFSSAWFTQLGESKKQQEQLRRGLKEHHSLMLFRDAKYDIGQNLGLFLVALMDRWVGIIMSAREPQTSMYTDSRARYGLCLCILYFLTAVVFLDTTLQKYWSLRYTLSKEKIVDIDHARTITSEWERIRHQKFAVALVELSTQLLFLFGLTTLLLWILLDSPETMVLYYMYILGYTGVVLFQFNRCFTTNVQTHLFIILGSAAVALVVGCLLHAVPATAGWLYSDVVAQNVAAVLAAGGTLLWSWKDWTVASGNSSGLYHLKKTETFYVQHKLGAEPREESKASASFHRLITGSPHVRHGDGSFISQTIDQTLERSLAAPNDLLKSISWSVKLLETAIHTWESQQVEVVVISAERFTESGIHDLASYSVKDGDILRVAIGLFQESELGLPSWQSQIAQVIAESLLYHTARADKLPHSQAVHAEHFLSNSTNMSKRIHLELACGDVQYLQRLMQKTNSQILRHLSFDLDVDVTWDTLEPSVRQAIVCRVLGRDIKLSREMKEWMSTTKSDLQTLDFHLQLSLDIFHYCTDKLQTALGAINPLQDKGLLQPSELRPVGVCPSSPKGGLRGWFRGIASLPLVAVRWIAVISSGGSNIERELSACLSTMYFKRPILWICLKLWKVCRTAKNFWVYYLLISHRPSIVRTVRLVQHGAARVIKKSSIMIELTRKTITGFSSVTDDGTMVLKVFDGRLKDVPEDQQPLFTATYDTNLRLLRKVDEDGTSSSYHYPTNLRKAWPLSREVFGSKTCMKSFYDKHGRTERGVMTLNSLQITFVYYYKKTPHDSGDILRADFKSLDGDSTNKLSVFWGKPLRQDARYYDWIPSERIYKIVRVVDGKTYTTEFEYHHRRDPKVITYLDENGVHKVVVAVPPRVFPHEESLLPRPRNLLFDADDMLIRHKRREVKYMWQYAANNMPIATRFLRSFTWWSGRVYLPVATWRSRTELWGAWLKGSFDAPTACFIDELILRREPLLAKYWRARDCGRLDKARAALEEDIDQIVAAIELETDVSELCLLPIKSADLYAMGLAKDANQVTNRPQDCYNDTKDRISVIVNDIGCWPEAPGGVSNCRRDLVNGHSTIRNHVMAECANEYGIPRFQIEKNVQSLKLLPLWGLDGKTADHGLIDNILQSEVDNHIRDTDAQKDIVRIFVPLLKDFVKGARTKDFTRASLVAYTNVMLSMSKYFESKDYNKTWSSKQVEDAWVEAWLMRYDDPNIRDSSEFFDIERPTLFDFREALGIYIAYFFIFSVRIPEKCPRVFQCTHHGISSLLGVILKYRRGVTFGIWDHAILWRESCLNISPAQCELPISVQSMLLHGVRLASRLSYFHADVITPCTSLFNP